MMFLANSAQSTPQDAASTQCCLDMPLGRQAHYPVNFIAMEDLAEVIIPCINIFVAGSGTGEKYANCCASQPTSLEHRRSSRAPPHAGKHSKTRQINVQQAIHSQPNCSTLGSKQHKRVNLLSLTASASASGLSLPLCLIEYYQKLQKCGARLAPSSSRRRQMIFVLLDLSTTSWD
ncbi:hypothetical protein BTVI_120421 [Pitangus sulphuratus]|nr:hypothetical protein BTVI_120421 [Pitangus sulphuratus]